MRRIQEVETQVETFDWALCMKQIFSKQNQSFEPETSETWVTPETSEMTDDWLTENEMMIRKCSQMNQ